MAELKPRAPIRRFDVFAEYNRIKAMNEEHLSAAKAKGYGLWLVKVVAAQKFGRLPKDKAEQEKKVEKTDRRGWHLLGGEAQADKLFDKESINRMGADFYRKVFSPAIRKAYAEKKGYMVIRDSIRKAWKPD